VPNQVWYSVASSADGSKSVASGSGGIYVSTNSGSTWVQTGASGEYWPSVASSTDGNKLVAAAGLFAVGGDRIYTLDFTPSPYLNITSTNGALAFSWIIPSTNFVLQQSSDLSTWTDLTNTPVLNLTNLQNELVLSPTSSSGFYRLKTP
jgi:hypothetical protein